jgi:dihydroneopterin aldolase
VIEPIESRIFLRDLELSCSIGVHPHERAQRQRILVDVELLLAPPPADMVDHMRAVLDYDFVRTGALAIVRNRHFELQETLCRAIFELCAAESRVVGVRVSTRKPDVYPDCQAVGFQLSSF